MLTPPNCCIQVALSINRATCCFDTSHSRYRRAESGVPSCTFGGKQAQTATSQGMTVTTVTCPRKVVQRKCDFNIFRADAATLGFAISLVTSASDALADSINSTTSVRVLRHWRGNIRFCQNHSSLSREAFATLRRSWRCSWRLKARKPRQHRPLHCPPAHSAKPAITRSHFGGNLHDSWNIQNLN